MKSSTINKFTCFLITLLTINITYGDFTLVGNTHQDITTSHSQGWMYDNSFARIMAGGNVTDLYLYDSSNAEAFASSTVTNVMAYNNSIFEPKGGYVHSISANDSSIIYYYTDPGIHGCSIMMSQNSTLHLYDGIIKNLSVNSTSTSYLDAGSIEELEAMDNAIVYVNGKDFVLGSGLSLSGNDVNGKGILSGKWFDDTPFTMDIGINEAGVQILIPEPATVALLGLGMSFVMMKKRR